MESYLTFVARIIVISFVVIVATAAITPTSDKLVSSLPLASDSSPVEWETSLERPANTYHSVAVAGFAIFGLCLVSGLIWQCRVLSQVQSHADIIKAHERSSDETSRTEAGSWRKFFD